MGQETRTPPRSYARELEAAEAAARVAADLLAAEFARPDGPRASGYDKSPADTDAERVIRALLTREFPSYGFQAEEEYELDRQARDDADHVWVVDPNDGTSHFLRGARGASVSIALLRGDRPVLGVVLAHSAPFGGLDLVTWAEGCGPVRRNGVAVAPLPAAERLARGDVVLVAPSAESAVAENAELVTPARFRTCPSIAYRMALVAVGEAAATLSVNAPGPLDYAAAHAILRGAGGELVDGRGVSVRYGGAGRSTPAIFGGPPAIARQLASRHWDGIPRRRQSPVELQQPEPGRCARDAALLKRAQGALMGQLVGDALGAQVELRKAHEIAASHPDGVRELRDGGTWSTLAGQPTDDSELALALARVLVKHGWDPEEVAAAYARWYASGPFDCGRTVAGALAPAAEALERGATPGEIARVSALSASTTSKANGAMMRASPLALFGWDRPAEELAAWAREDARLTHANPVCGDASVVYLAAIAHALRTGATAAQVYEHACAIAESIGADPEVLAALRRAERELPAFTPHAGLVTIALQNAFHRLLHAGTFEEALVDTVGAGGDTDTNAAICGALLGAVHGVDAIPLRWRNAVLSCRPLAGLPGVRRPRPAIYWPVDALVLAERLVAR